jgi:glutamine synthetase
MLQDIVDQIERGGAKTAKAGGELKIGSSFLPTLPRDPGDRNRTSPFAFTGNKFEFRAVGSSQSVAGPIVALNTIVAESLDEFATVLEQAVASGKNLNNEIQTLLQQAVRESKDVIFNGDNYTEAWHAEAERRGLPNRRTSIDSLPDLISPKSIKLFTKYGVLSERELHSRFEIFVENYRKTINIESNLTMQIAKRMILPASLRYQAQIADAITSLKNTGATVPKSQAAHLNELVRAIDDLQGSIDRLGEAIDEHPEGDSLSHAKHARDVIIPAMNAVRSAGDQLELFVAEDLWPLPTYQEMLFVK